MVEVSDSIILPSLYKGKAGTICESFTVDCVMIYRLSGIVCAAFSVVADDTHSPGKERFRYQTKSVLRAEVNRRIITGSHQKDVAHTGKSISGSRASFWAKVASRFGFTVMAANNTHQVVLVTGGAGFLGQHIVKLLQERTDDVTEIRVFDVKPYENTLGHREDKPLTSIVGDIRKADDVRHSLKGVDAVIHTAGRVHVGVFPDWQGMEEVNVEGTRNVIDACIQCNVPRLISTSTIDVVIGYDEIVDGDESLPVPDRFLFEGYPDTKQRAEKLVLESNGRTLSNGNEKLRTLSLRPNVMYGEGDPHFITKVLRTAKQHGGVMSKVGDGSALFQQAYVGNVAWGHVLGNRALSQDASLGGNAYFVTDDSPPMWAFNFMEPFLKLRGFSLSRFSIPYSFAYCLMYSFEAMLHAVKPIKQFNIDANLSSLIYTNMTIYFSSKRARKLFGYQPLYTYDESMRRSMEFYKDVPI